SFTGGIDGIAGLSFDNLPGTVGTLSVAPEDQRNDLQVTQLTSLPGTVDIIYPNGATDITYDPTKFIYTDPQGRAYRFENGSVTSVTEPNGNKILIATDGVTFLPPSGPGRQVVKIVRSSGRVTKLYGPSELTSATAPATIL